MAKKKTKDTKGLAGIVKNVPRELDIKGQKHMLAWITPKEGETLKALGGAGILGPMGIPTYYDEGDDYGGPGGDQTGDDTAEMGGDDGGGADDRNQREQAKVDEARANLEKSIAEHGGGTFANPMQASMMRPEDFRFKRAQDVLGYDLKSQALGLQGQDRKYGGITREQYANMPNYMKTIYDKTGAYNFDIDPETGKVTGFYHDSLLPENPLISIAKKIFGKKPEEMTELDLPGVYTGRDRGAMFDDGKGRDDDRRGGLSYLQAAPKEEVTPVSVSPADYYGKGIGSATIDMSDPLQRERFLMSLYGYTPSPIGATFDQPTSSYTIPGGSKKSRTRLRGLDIFKPVTL